MVAASGWTIRRARQSRNFDPSRLATTYACEVPEGDGTDGTFNPDDWLEPKEQRKIDRFIMFGLAAVSQAVSDAGLKGDHGHDPDRIGVLIGSGIGGLQSIAETAVMIQEKGPRRVSPFFIPGSLINLISGQVPSSTASKAPIMPL